jgi:hypothetical protein
MPEIGLNRLKGSLLDWCRVHQLAAHIGDDPVRKKAVRSKSFVYLVGFAGFRFY